MVVVNTYNQLKILLSAVEVLQYNKAPIPRELLEKMFKIVHLAGMRCSYDKCDYQLSPDKSGLILVLIFFNEFINRLKNQSAHSLLSLKS